MLDITPVGAFSDNYIWVLQREGHAVAVDPGDAKPLLDFLSCRQLTLTAVLVTHHHYDHTGGLEQLIEQCPGLSIYGPSSLPRVTQPVSEASVITVLGITALVLEVPGHTLDHLAYRIQEHLFCGDTLFGAGCGRVFEGKAELLYQSLMSIATLPAETLLYPAHEYTLANLAFAQVIEPGNPAIAARLTVDRACRQRHAPTLPSTLSQELATNPFLRTHEPAVVASACQHSGRPLLSGVEVFCELRNWKNHF